MSIAQKWLIAYFVIEAVIAVAIIGRPRKPVDPLTALIVMGMSAVMIGLVMHA